MQFGLFYQLHVPRPWHSRSEYEVFRQAIDQVVQAEQEGFEYTWLAEHHLLEEVSHSSAPDLLMAAMAERTATMRLGHGVVLVPSPLNHPLRVAERVATLDILSGGRVEFGTGRSSTSYQLTPFGISLDDTRAMWEEAIRIIPKMWTQDSFEHKGPYFDIPRRNVVPKPLQKPHPPMWAACLQPETARLAGERGLGALFMTTSGPDRLPEQVEVYRKAAERAEPVGAEVNKRVAFMAYSFCAENNEEARALGGPEALWYRETIQGIFNKAWDQTEVVPDSYKYHAQLNERRMAAGRADYNQYIDNGTFCIGRS